MNLVEAAAMFTGIAQRYEQNVNRALDDAAKIVQTEAKRVLGTHDYPWAPLQPETIARKANGDTPLLETGEMRDSIQRTVQGQSAYVGSDNDKALWHELGTSRNLPPRSFLAQAAQEKGPEAAQAIAAEITSALTTSASIGYSHYTGAVSSTPALHEP